MEYQSYSRLNWCDLDWTPWIDLKATPTERKPIPRTQGVYRVKAKNFPTLIYIGQTTNLKTRTQSLARHTYSLNMPWNDPHTAASNLWAWRNDKQWDYEISVSQTNLSTQNREALECYLLWKYRLEQGESTLCNHGRFHPDYKKPSNRRKNRPGYKLDTAAPRNPNGGPSKAPLKEHSDFLSSEWMGLEWSPFTQIEDFSIPETCGLYRIRDSSKKELLYIGETDKLKKRINQHKARFPKTLVSYSAIPVPLHYQRLELENDLIGGYYAINRCAPTSQFTQ